MNNDEQTIADTTALKQRGRPFEPGKSGNPTGRPKGARNKLTELFLSTVAKDFAEYGEEVLTLIRKEDPVSYFKIISSFIPKELIMQLEKAPTIDYSEISDEELVELLKSAKRRRDVEGAIRVVSGE